MDKKINIQIDFKPDFSAEECNLRTDAVFKKIMGMKLTDVEKLRLESVKKANGVK